jgi:hypothetical protein
MEKINSSLGLFVTRNGLGEAPDELQQILVKNYFALLVQEDVTPGFICFYANGVKLACTGSPIQEELKELENRGAKIIICKTCLNYFHLADQVSAGMIGTMHDILDIQLRVEKIVNI